jgi:hypothetical protein
MISHDWHVQPSCQRPNRGPPRRREFSPGENARKHFRLSSKLYNHTVRRKSRQSSLPTEFPDDFHIGNFLEAGSGELPKPNSRLLTGLSARFGMTMLFGGRSLLRATVWSSVGTGRHFRRAHFATGILRSHFATARTEDRKLRKDLYYLEVLALKVPFGTSLSKTCLLSE